MNHCGTCKYHKRVDWIEFACDCPESPNCGEVTEAHDSCEFYEEWRQEGKPLG